MAEFPGLTIWTDAYLADTKHLSTIEHGAYLLLLIIAWRSRDCCLPDDDKLLARYVGMTSRQWARIRPVMETFHRIENGVWYNDRLLKERVFVRRQYQQRSDAGKASALKRKESRSTDVEISFNETATPTPTPKYNRDTNVSLVISPETAKRPEPDPIPAMIDIWREVCVPTLSDVRKITTPRRQKLLKRLKEDFGDDPEQWRAFCARIMRSPHLTGENERGWKADLDWVIEPAKCIRILEGRYDNGIRNQSTRQGTWL